MRVVSLQDLLELAEKRAEEDRKVAEKILRKSQATILSVRNVIERFPDRGFYEESKAESSFKAKVLELLNSIKFPSELETSAMEELFTDLNYFQVEVARIGARLIPKFDRSRKLDVAELELNMRELAKVAAQLQNMPKKALRQAEEVKQIVERIKSQIEDLKRLEAFKNSITSEVMQLKDEEARVRQEMAGMEGSELALKLKKVNAEILMTKQEVEMLFAPVAKPIEKLKKVMKDETIQAPQVEALAKCIENPLEILEVRFEDLGKASEILRSYIEKGYLQIKQSRSKRALQAISEMRSKVPALKERLGLLLKSREEMLASPEVAVFSEKFKEMEERLRQLEQRLSALDIEKTNIDSKIEGCSSKMKRLRSEAEKLAGDIFSEQSLIAI